MTPKRIYLAVCGGFFMLSLVLWGLTPYYDFTLNLTHSLPGHLYVIERRAPVDKGDLIAFRWHGGATYPRGTIFIKVVEGTPGDLVVREGASFSINGKPLGVAKPQSKAGVPLAPAAGGVIAPDEFYVGTPNVDSLDSRYSLVGNVKATEVIGRAYALF